MNFSTPLFVLLFTCQTPVQINDPDFQQGSETFLKIYGNKETKELFLEKAKFSGSPEVLFNKKGANFAFGTSQSSIAARFDEGLLSMVYLGPSGDTHRWGAFVKENDWEEEFFCTEKSDVLKF